MGRIVKNVKSYKNVFEIGLLMVNGYGIGQLYI